MLFPRPPDCQPGMRSPCPVHPGGCSLPVAMFRPCIDLHQGKVKQIVGGSLGVGRGGPRTNFVSDRPASWYARLYRNDGLEGGHVILLGPGNEAVAREALGAYPGGLQVGGGMTPENAEAFLEAGASRIIMTSWLFEGDHFRRERLVEISRRIGRERLVVDLSCRKVGDGYRVTSNRWRTITSLELTRENLDDIGEHCAEFLVHAADIEGLCLGVDFRLVELLSRISPLPVTYAGGARRLDDLRQVRERGAGRVDLTIGSALDIFGGQGVRYADAVAFNRSLRLPSPACSPYDVR